MTTTMTPDRAGHYLTWVRRELDRLRAIDAAGGLSALSVEDRMAMRLEWEDVVDRYLAVVAPYERGQLPPALATRLVDLSSDLAAFAPELERMRLRRPDPELLDRIRLAAAS